ncbi:putative uncharacterized protein ASB16-AS1 [Equus caballus]|uniref:putative uncharacterized protein ASB16-AS1 n=1 Tax=Equus caballus TaxID=9796 RepID=UPI0038B3922C
MSYLRAKDLEADLCFNSGSASYPRAWPGGTPGSLASAEAARAGGLAVAAARGAGPREESLRSRPRAWGPPARREPGPEEGRAGAVPASRSLHKSPQPRGRAGKCAEPGRGVVAPDASLARAALSSRAWSPRRPLLPRGRCPRCAWPRRRERAAPARCHPVPGRRLPPAEPAMVAARAPALQPGAP